MFQTKNENEMLIIVKRFYAQLLQWTIGNYDGKEIIRKVCTYRREYHGQSVSQRPS